MWNENGYDDYIVDSFQLVLVLDLVLSTFDTVPVSIHHDLHYLAITNDIKRYVNSSPSVTDILTYRTGWLKTNWSSALTRLKPWLLALDWTFLLSLPLASLSGTTIPLLSSMKSLGVMLNSILFMHPASPLWWELVFLSLMPHRYPSLSEYCCHHQATCLLYFFRLDCCNFLFTGLPSASLHTLQSLQHALGS